MFPIAYVVWYLLFYWKRRDIWVNRSISVQIFFYTFFSLHFFMFHNMCTTFTQVKIFCSHFQKNQSKKSPNDFVLKQKSRVRTGPSELLHKIIGKTMSEKRCKNKNKKMQIKKRRRNKKLHIRANGKRLILKKRWAKCLT